jgi:hypothetical protein
MHTFRKLWLLILIATSIVVVVLLLFTRQSVHAPTMEMQTSVSTTTTSLPTKVPSKPTPQPTPGPVILQSISPAEGAIGSSVTLYGSGFTESNTVLLDGNVAVSDASLTSFTNGHQSIVFTIPSSIHPDCKPREACPMYVRLVNNGEYSVVVENANGVSNALSYTVVGGIRTLN